MGWPIAGEQQRQVVSILFMSEDPENRNPNDASGEEALDLTDPRVKLRFVELLQSVLQYGPALSSAGRCTSTWVPDGQAHPPQSFDMPLLERTRD